MKNKPHNPAWVYRLHKFHGLDKDCPKCQATYETYYKPKVKEETK